MSWNRKTRRELTMEVRTLSERLVEEIARFDRLFRQVDELRGKLRDFEYDLRTRIPTMGRDRHLARAVSHLALRGQRPGKCDVELITPEGTIIRGHLTGINEDNAVWPLFEIDGTLYEGVVVSSWEHTEVPSE